MEVDIDTPNHEKDACVENNAAPLKRSNSAPMLAECCTFNGTVSEKQNNNHNIRGTSPPNQRPSSFSSIRDRETVERIRRFSTSTTILPGGATPVKTPHRLEAIKRQESRGVAEDEAAHEREFQAAFLLTQSCEELSVNDPEPMSVDKRPRSFQEPLQVITGYSGYSSSPSPNRTVCHKQCYSPSLQQAVRPSDLHSPTRKTYRRSLSPIAAPLQPSKLGAVLNLKRKLEPMSGVDCSPAKRFHFHMSSPVEGADQLSPAFPTSSDDSSDFCASPPIFTSSFSTPTPSVTGYRSLDRLSALHSCNRLRDSVDSVSVSTPSHSSETSDNPECGDPMVTEYSLMTDPRGSPGEGQVSVDMITDETSAMSDGMSNE